MRSLSLPAPISSAMREASRRRGCFPWRETWVAIGSRRAAQVLTPLRLLPQSLRPKTGEFVCTGPVTVRGGGVLCPGDGI